MKLREVPMRLLSLFTAIGGAENRTGSDGAPFVLRGNPNGTVWLAYKETPKDAERFVSEVALFTDGISAGDMTSNDRLITLRVADVGPIGNLERRAEVILGSLVLELKGADQRWAMLAAFIAHANSLLEQASPQLAAAS